MSLKAAATMARRRGIDGIAITDHDLVNNHSVLKRMEESVGVLIIDGVEVTTDVGDIIGLFIQKPLNTDGTAIETIHAIHRQNGIAIFAHPFKRRVSVPESIIKQVDAIEGMNSRTSWSKNNRAIDLAYRHKKPLTAGSDAHFSFEVGKACTYFKIQGVNNHGSDSLKPILPQAILQSPRIFICKESPMVVEGFSQIVSGIRRRQPRRFLHASLAIALGIHSCIRGHKTRKLMQYP